jgi:F-type H+-transporting ATPase subunit delta
MITIQTFNYGKVLYSLKISEEVINSTKNLLSNNNYLLEVLANPTIKVKEKEGVISKIFQKEIVAFIKLLCDNNCIMMVNDIFEAYDNFILEEHNIVKAKLYYVIKPGEEEIEQIKDMVRKKFDKEGVYLELVEDKSLIGGFVLCVNNTEYNRSMKGNLLELQKTLSRR